MNHHIPLNKAVRRKGVTIAAAALSVALVAPFAQSVAYPEISAAAQAQTGTPPVREVQKLKQNPPTYYANAFATNNVYKAGRKLNGDAHTAGPRSVRITGILGLPDEAQYENIQTIFPKGTTFELQNRDFSFTSDGWMGVNRAKGHKAETEKLAGARESEMISKAGAGGEIGAKRWPYVVPETGQIIFGLWEGAEGTSETVPLRARWTDQNTGKNFVWNFEQRIEVGIGRAPKAAAPKADEILIQNIAQEKLINQLMKPADGIDTAQGKLGAFVVGTADSGASSNYGFYQGPKGQLAETARKQAETKNYEFSEEVGTSQGVFKKEDLPSNTVNHYDFKYAPVKGTTESGRPQFHVEGKPDEVVTFRREGGQNSPHPAGAKFAFDGELPEGAQGASIDAETGVVTLANPVDAQVSIPVKVTYDDGTEDKSSVVFIPAEKKLNDTVQPSYTTPGDGKLQSEAPIFHPQDDLGSVVDKPENTRFELGENAPEGLQVEVDEQSGVVTVRLGEGESLQNPVEVPVKVIYSDDSVDTATVEFTPAATPDSRTADELTPSYKPLTVEQGQTTTLEAPTFDKVETPDATESDPAPAGTTFKPGDLSSLPDGLTATVNENDGSVELTVGEGVQADDYTVPVTVTYNDGSQDTAEVSVTVEAKAEDPEPPAQAPVADDLGYSQDIFVAPDNYKRSDSTGMPNLPGTIEKQDGDFFRFGKLPDGFDRNPNPSWNGVEEIIREGADESERVLLRLNNQNGKVEVHAGPDADYSLQELPVEYADANGNLKGKDTVSVTVRPIAHSWNGEPTESENGSVNVPYTGNQPGQTGDLTAKVTNGSGEVALDENGNINYAPGAGDQPGDEIQVSITDSEGDHVRDVVFKIPSQSDEYAPEAADVFVFRGQDANEVAGEGVANKGELPEGTTFAFKGDVDTSVVGTLPEAQTVVVTYPDGSTDEVEVDVRVVDGTEHAWDTDSPVKGDDGDVTVSYTGEGADALGDGAGVEVRNGDGVASLDEGGNVIYTPGAGDKPGDVVQVEVFDGDGDSVGVIEFAIPSFADQREPVAKDGVTTSEGEKLDPGALIANKDDLPAGTKFEWEKEPNFGVPGERPGVVKVNYPDGSSETVDVTVSVSEVDTQADEHDPKGQSVAVAEGETPDAAAGIANKGELPEGTEFEFDGPVDTSTPGEKSAKVIVAYPDGSTDAVDVTVSVSEVDTQADKHDPRGKTVIVPQGGVPDAAAGIANKGELPEGTEFEFDGPVDTSTPGEKSAKVIVAYPDGSTESVDVTVNVAAAEGDLLSDADRYDPKWESVNTPEDGSAVTVPNSGDDFPAYDWTDVDLVLKPEDVRGQDPWDVVLNEDGSITVTPGADAKGGDKVEVDVELTYPDGSTETVTFTVTVPDAREAFTRDNFGQPPLTAGGGTWDDVDFSGKHKGDAGEIEGIRGSDDSHSDDDISAEDIFTQAERHEPKAKDGVTAEEGQTPDAGALIDNKGDLPVGTTFEWDTKPDVSEPGKTSGVVKVNYPDGSSETVKVELEVSEVPTQADEFEPKGKTIIVAQGGNPDAAEGVANKGELPERTEFEFDGPVDTSTPGEKSAKVIVAYPDGSTDAVEVKVQVGAAEQDLLPDTDRYEPEWNDTTIDDPSQVTVENKGDELPHGTEVELSWSHNGLNQGKEDWDVDLEENGDITITPGADAQPLDAIVVEVELNYPDGSSETKSFVVQVSDDDNDDLTAGDIFTEAPTVNPVHPGDDIISGTGKPGATITVTGPNGFSTTTTVHENGNWSVDLTGGATPETQFIVSQKDGDKNESVQVLVTVGGDNKPLPNPGSSELPGSSLGSSNFDIPKHLQCAVFAGGVTAIPLILLSPMHNMYEMMINPHLNGLREQFHRELHALDQQVRRGLGVEGHPALQFMDHINARVNEFNQQLGQVAHDNRHIGLAAAAIAVAGLSFQHCMNTQAASSSSASSVDLSSSSQEQAPARNEAKEDNAGGIVGWFQGLFNRN